MAKEGNSQIRLGRVELQIMNVVWEKGKATVHDVKDAGQLLRHVVFAREIRHNSMEMKPD